MYRITIYFLLLLVAGCNSTINDDAKNYYSDDLGYYLSTTPESIHSDLNNHNLKYKMLYLDLYNDSNKRKIFLDFAISLGEYGVVADFPNLSKEKKKRYLSLIQKKLGTNYEYYYTPFLVFIKKDRDNFYITDLLTFSNTPIQCIKEQLDRIERKIYSQEEPNNLTNYLDKIKQVTCSSTNIIYPEINELLKIIGSLL